MSKIVLGEEYREIIFNYHEKWKTIAWSTDRVNLEQAEEAIHATYLAMGLKSPKVIFCNSPNTDLLDLLYSNNLKHKVGRSLIKRLRKWKYDKLESPLLDLWFESLDWYQWSFKYILDDRRFKNEVQHLDQDC